MQRHAVITTNLSCHSHRQRSTLNVTNEVIKNVSAPVFTRFDAVHFDFPHFRPQNAPEHDARKTIGFLRHRAKSTPQFFHEANPGATECRLTKSQQHVHHCNETNQAEFEFEFSRDVLLPGLPAKSPSRVRMKNNIANLIFMKSATGFKHRGTNARFQPNRLTRKTVK